MRWRCATSGSIDVRDLQLRPCCARNTAPLGSARADAPAASASAARPGPKPRRGLGEQLEDMERAAIIKALEQTRYNKTAAAKLLGMTFRALRYRIKKLGIE